MRNRFDWNNCSDELAGSCTICLFSVFCNSNVILIQRAFTYYMQSTIVRQYWTGVKYKDVLQISFRELIYMKQYIIKLITSIVLFNLGMYTLPF